MYSTLADIKSYLSIASSSDDALLTQLATRAQAMIDTLTGRTFEASDSSRSFDAVLDVDESSLILTNVDLCAISSITNGDGTTIASSKYVTDPRTPPFYEIRLLKSANLTWLSKANGDSEDAISIVGKWAYSVTAPNDIAHAHICLTAWLYRQKDTAQDVDRPILAGDGNVIMPVALPKDIREMLAPYRRLA